MCLSHKQDCGEQLMIASPSEIGQFKLPIVKSRCKMLGNNNMYICVALKHSKVLLSLSWLVCTLESKHNCNKLINGDIDIGKLQVTNGHTCVFCVLWSICNLPPATQAGRQRKAILNTGSWGFVQQILGCNGCGSFNFFNASIFYVSQTQSVRIMLLLWV